MTELVGGVRLERLTEFAGELADEARAIARQHFGQRVEVEHKADQTPVTIADRSIEARLRDRIADRFPTHGMVGEEFGAEHDDAECVWVIDPIDGTQAFVSGVPLFGCLIALLVSGQPMLGVLEMPALEDRWLGTPHGTWRGAQCARVSETTELGSATVFATTPHMFNATEKPAFDAVAAAARRVRYGTDCFAYGLLADGWADVVVEADMAAYDYLALVPVVTGAGGVITDWQGAPLSLEGTGRILAAATTTLHAQLLESLGRV